MTSNIGAEYISFKDDQTTKIEVLTKNKILEEVKKNFKPEFLNRIDDLIVFNRLTRNEIKKIIDIQIKNLITILKAKKISFEIDDKAKEWLVNEGFSESYGARPLKRVIQTEIQNKIAHLIVSNKIKEGNSLKISSNTDNELIIEYD